MMPEIRILAITARYPPNHFGGYEIRSKNIIDELYSRGHRILVITSKKETFQKPSLRVSEYKLFRNLHIRKNSRHFIIEVICDLLDVMFLDRQIKTFQPNVIYLGHVNCLSKALLPYLAECKIPIVYDEGGIGLIHSWEKRGKWFYFIEEYINRYSLVNRIKPLVVNIISKVSGNKIKTQWAWPANMQIYFNSELNLKNALAKGVPVNGAKVIHSGIDVKKFNFISKTNIKSPLSIIVPGRIEPLKGQKDAVKLLLSLRENNIDGNIVFAGENFSSSYYSEIEKEINEFHMEGKVIILPMVEQDKLIDLYHGADICFFPSYHKTGYSRVPLEAMACGCIVLSYGNEASNEFIRNRQTGYIVPSGDYGRIAKIIRTMISNPKMVEEMVHNARKGIEDNHGMQKYIDKIEAVVIDAAETY